MNPSIVSVRFGDKSSIITCFTSSYFRRGQNNKTRIFRLDHVELLCDILVCEPNDLLVWTPDKGKHYSENNPLVKLKQQSEVSWQETISKMTFQELKEISNTIVEKKKNG